MNMKSKHRPRSGAAIHLFSTIALMSLLINGGCSSGFQATRTDQRSVDHVRGTPIVVTTRNGRVSVVGDRTLNEVVIHADISAGGGSPKEANDRLGRTRLDIVRDTSGTLTIKPIFPTPHRSGDGAAISVQLPDASSVRITTSNGRITASDVDAALTASSSNGRITVTDWIGDADLSTSNGRIQVADLDGSLTARTSNGRVKVESLSGSADVKTSNGSITLALRPDSPGPIDLQTSNSSITAEVGPAFAGTMTMRTSNGSITVDDVASIIADSRIERRSADLTFRDDGPVSRLRSSNGRLTLRIMQ